MAKGLGEKNEEVGYSSSRGEGGGVVECSAKSKRLYNTFTLAENICESNKINVGFESQKRANE